LIVALGALLGMLGGAATASPALARGPKWTFNPPETFTMDGVCAFPVDVTQTGLDKSFTKGIRAADGSTAMLTNGVRDFTFTNPANGKTITTRDSGSTVATFYPDGSLTAVQHGAAYVGIVGGAPGSGLPALFESAGKLTLSIDASGNLSLSLQGHVLVDICAALS